MSGAKHLTVICVKNADEAVVKVVGPFPDWMVAQEWAVRQGFEERGMFAFPMPVDAP